MKILATSDIRHLEGLLLERIDQCARGAGSQQGERSGKSWCRWDPLLVLVPTGRLAQYLKRRILEHRVATLGVHIFTHLGLSKRALEHALNLPPRILPSVALVHLVGRLLEGLPRGEASYLDRYAGARRAVVSTFEELREATVDATQLRALLGSELPSWFVDLYQRFEEALEKLTGEGWTDTTGLTRLAFPLVERFLVRKNIRAIIHHGAYELTGVNVQLVEALDRVVEVEYLLPADVGPPAYRYAQRFVELLERRGTAAVVKPAARAATTKRDANDWHRRLSALYTHAPADDREGETHGDPEGDRKGETGPLQTPLDTGVPNPPPAAPVTQLDWIDDPPAAAGTPDPEPPAGEGETSASLRGPRLELRHTQGAQAELRAAALRALTLHSRDGVPWNEIAIVARSLEPYAPFLEQTFETLGVPFTTSASLPLARAPDVSTFLGLVRLYARDFERGAVIAVLRRGGVRFAGEPPAPLDIDQWDRWSRQSRIVRHLSQWRELSGRPDPSAVGACERENAASHGGDTRHGGSDRPGRQSLDRLSEILDDLAQDAEAWRRARSLEEHAAVLETIARRRLVPSGRDVDAREGGDRQLDVREAGESAPVVRSGLDGHLGRVLAIIDALRDTERTTGAESRDLEMDDVLRWLEEAASETSLPLRTGDDTGVRVLDLMQTRGLSHRVVQWLGFHHGLFPRIGRADPYLSDAARVRLRETTGMPMGLELEAADEERLLLGMTLASAGDLLCISWQRADEAGRKRARSTALREIARVFTGRPDVKRLGEPAGHEPRASGSDHGLDDLPAHCGERALSLAGSPRFGIVPVMDVVAAAAASARHPIRQADKLLKALGADSSDRDAALEWLRHVEDFRSRGTSGGLDGMTGLGIDEGRDLSSTALEHLTVCPQAFFLRYVLDVRELDDEAEAHRIEVRILGTAVHDTLEALYARLEERGAFRSERGEATAMARDLLPGLWNSTLESVAGPSSRRLRGLFRLLGRRWLDSLSRFVVGDIEAIFDAEVEPVCFEGTCHATVKLGEDTHVKAFGRFDRVLKSRDRTFVDDYKTAGDLTGRTSAGNFLHGRHLQLPLYREIIAATTGTSPASIHARCLGVGPDFDGDRRSEAALEWNPKVRAGFLETLAVALALARSGRFPLNDNSSRCPYCAYRSTCRRSHEPTVERLRNDPSLRDYFDLAEKTKYETSLDEVRRKRALQNGGKAAKSK